MSKALTTVFRSEESLERAANDCRQLGQLATDLNFNIVDLIVGPLVNRFRDRLKFNLFADNELSRPAEVRVSNNRQNITLCVRLKTWDDAINNEAEARRILAHEIAHIWLHCDETYGFSEPSEEEHPFIAPLYFVENQANIFADILLMPTKAIENFDCVQELLEYCSIYCNIPEDVIKRRFESVKAIKRNNFKPIYGEYVCTKCGGNRVKALHSYRKCDDCRHTIY